MIGVLIDRRYEIVQVLGKGAFGQTFLAKDTKRPGHPDCVIKQLHYFSNNPQALQHARRLFKKEAEILEKLGHHDQIPTLLADLEEGQEFYLVEQFIPGQSLAHEIGAGKSWSEARVSQFLTEVLTVLAFVHSQGVIHRDLKPGNLMRRDTDGKIVLIDFGAVKELETQIAQGQNAPTIAIGTPGYMSYEQFNGQPQFNSDIYALGVTAIQALLGLAPEAVSSLKDPSSTPPGELVWRDRQPVSPALADILDKMVLADCRQRYQSANQVLSDLVNLGMDGVLGRIPPTQPIASTLAPTQPPAFQRPSASPTHPISPTQPIAPTQPITPTPSTRRKRWMVAGLTAVLTLGGILYSQRPLIAEVFYNQGRDRARYGDIRGALANFDRAIQIFPNYADAYARRCGSRLTLKDDEGARSDCQQALDLDPNNAIGHLNWGNIYAGERDQVKANEFYTQSVQLSSRLIQLDSSDADAYYFRSAGRFRLGDYRGAIDDATQAIDLDSEYANAYVTRCQAHGQLSEAEQAIENCQQATEINPNFYAAFASLCNHLSNAGRHEEAIEACTRALQINPNDSHAYNNRGVVWVRLGNYQAAVDDYRQAMQRDAKDAVARHNLGDVLAIQGDRPGAIQAYTEAIEINPDFAAAYYGRGIRQAELGNDAEAIADLQKAADLYAQQRRQDRVADARYQMRRVQEGAFQLASDTPAQPADSPATDPPATDSGSTPSSAPSSSPRSTPRSTPVGNSSPSSPANPVGQEPPPPCQSCSPGTPVCADRPGTACADLPSTPTTWIRIR
ncbi:protein kinase domain-containing protein [Egbenema bharatensis]|uniref:protein kinase domain-containing protein n=1 Tax=Egbenema bharatensis TaxID=3463334 RepID=UPI003A8AFFDE